MRQCSDLVFEGDGFTGGIIEMHGRRLAACCRFAGLDIAHVIRETKRPRAQFEHAAADFDDVAGEQLALITDVLLDRSHAAAAVAN